MRSLEIFNLKDKLEYLDEVAELEYDDYESVIPEELRWSNWAADDEGITGITIVDLPDGEGVCSELLFNEKMSKTLSRGTPFKTQVSACSAAVWKVEHKKIKPIQKVRGQKRHKNNLNN